MKRAYRKWTDDEDAQLLFLHEHCGKPLAVIERMLERPKDAARGRYRVLRPKLPPVIAEPASRRTQRMLLDDAIRSRAALSTHGPLTVTAAFFGDPPPGRSALDKIPRMRLAELGGGPT